MNKSLLVPMIVSLLASLPGCHRDDSVSARRGALVVTGASARSIASVASTPVVVATEAKKEVTPASTSAVPGAAKRAPSASGKLKVKRLVVAKGVEKREPVGAAASFSSQEAARLYGFVELENPSRTESDVVLSFERADASDPRGNVKLAVGASPRWRTWGFSRAVKDVGTWSVVVRDAEGTELARERFEVTL